MSDLYLAHHGIKGMKWGVRRFQNDDGSLTDAGRARYGNSTNYAEKAGAIKTSFRDSLVDRRDRRRFGRKYEDKTSGEVRAAELRRREGIYNTRSKQTMTGKPQSERGKAKWEKKAAKARAKAEKQELLNANRAAYDAHTKTGKMFLQNAIFGTSGAEEYRNARAMGSSKGAAFVRGLLYSS